MRRRFVLTAALAVGLLAGQAGPGMASTQPAPVSQPAAALTLAERLLAPPGPPGHTPKATLLPGRLPDVEVLRGLPMPPDAALIGSLARDGNAKMGPGTSYELVLDAPGGSADLLAFYRRELAAHGWDAQHGGGQYPPFGFQPTMQSGHAVFCKGQGGPWLNLSIWPRGGAPTDVRLQVTVATPYPGPCGMPGGRGMPERMPHGFEQMPPLYPPDGAELQMGGGPARMTSEAVAETSLSPADVEAHFARQLGAAGWARQAGAAAPGTPVAWSTWRRGEWRGVLYAAEGAGDQRKWLRFEIESPTAGRGGPYPMPVRPAVAPPAPAPVASARREADPAAVPPVQAGPR